MKCICVLLAVVATVSGWRLPDLVRDEWQVFKLEHKKQYETAEEDRHRMRIYLKRRHMIAKHNSRFHSGLESFSLKINQFADMRHQEYLKISTGFKHQSNIVQLDSDPTSDVDASDGGAVGPLSFRLGVTGFILPERRKSNNPATKFMSPANVTVNETVDWRQLGAVSRIQNQLECSSCWAFAATGALEGQLFLKNHVLVPLSPQNLVDCSKKNCACKHGDPKTAFEYIQENKGIDTEEYYPYKAKKETCRYNSDYSGGSDSGFRDVLEGDENALKTAVATIGPVSAAIDASPESLMFYEGGVYYSPECSTNLTHAVLVVGYGTDNCDGDYWLLKNSYGTTWGEVGYMRLARNRENHCGIASFASYPLLSNKTALISDPQNYFNQ